MLFNASNDPQSDSMTPRITSLKPPVTRFAPSPTGLLHLGHAYAALVAHDTARQHGGRFILRLEDIDKGRCRQEFETHILDDLTWLGLKWEEPVHRQSDHMASYHARLDTLRRKELIYPCFCTRKEIVQEVKRMGSAPHGPDGPLYPGTCRTLSDSACQKMIASGAVPAWRLNIGKALHAIDHKTLTFHEQGKGPTSESGVITANASLFGDIILGRKDTGVSYHLAVTLDDHKEGITLVTRGEDLFAATHVQRLLQELLQLEIPLYAHHKLIYGADGRRLAKRDKDMTLKELKKSGSTPDDIREMLGLTNPAAR